MMTLEVPPRPSGPPSPALPGSASHQRSAGSTPHVPRLRVQETGGAPSEMGGERQRPHVVCDMARLPEHPVVRRARLCSPPVAALSEPPVAPLDARRSPAGTRIFVPDLFRIVV